MHWIEAKYRRFYSVLSASKTRVFGSILFAFALLLIWKTFFIAGAILGAIQLVGMFILPILRAEYALMSLLTYPVGKAIGFIAMGVVYFTIITPIGLFKKRNFPEGWIESVKETNPNKMFE